MTIDNAILLSLIWVCVAWAAVRAESLKSSEKYDLSSQSLVCPEPRQTIDNVVYCPYPADVVISSKGVKGNTETVVFTLYSVMNTLEKVYCKLGFQL